MNLIMLITRPYLNGFKVKNLGLTLNAAVKFTCRGYGNKSQACDESPKMIPEVMTSLTKELSEKLTGNVIANKFKLCVIRDELTCLATDQFPLPSSLTENQWKNLMRIKEKEFRIRYLDFIKTGGKNEEEALENFKMMDEMAAKSVEFCEDMFAEFAKKGDDLPNRVKQIANIYNQMRQKGKNLPFKVTRAERKDVYDIETPTGLKKIFGTLAKKREREVQSFIRKRIRQRSGVDEKKKIIDYRTSERHLVYGLGHNTLFMQIHKKALEKVENGNVIREFNPWGQTLVFDMQFMKDMNHKQAKNLVCKELLPALHGNRKFKDPFSIYFTSFNPNCDKCRLLTHVIPTVQDADYPAVVTEKHFTEIFPKVRLLYFSPDSRTNYLHLNDQDVFVIGAVNDRHNSTPKTLAEAKNCNIRHAKLPMKKYLGIENELQVNEMVGILNDFKQTEDWFYSFRWIPKVLFTNIIRSQGYNSKVDAISKAHAALTPLLSDNENLTPKQYRSKYREIITQSNNEEGDKSISNNKRAQ